MKEREATGCIGDGGANDSGCPNGVGRRGSTELSAMDEAVSGEGQQVQVAQVGRRHDGQGTTRESGNQWWQVLQLTKGVVCGAPKQHES